MQEADIIDYFQNAWVVPNLEEAIADLRLTHQDGPFFIIDQVQFDSYLYRGAPLAIDQRVALTQVGRMQLELVEIRTPGKTPFSEFVSTGDRTFHHMARVVPDVEAAIANYQSNGFEILAQGSTTGVPFALIDTWKKLGFVTEIVGDSSQVAEFAAMIAHAAIDWDGAEPIRYCAVPDA